MAMKFSERGIRVNGVAPGATPPASPMTPSTATSTVIPSLVQRTARSPREANDIDRVIAMLLSDDCGWITAETIEVSGGFKLDRVCCDGGCAGLLASGP
jgi:NAD(P)-dependent dehydrogenase (short-subunit alcohol dehydrogenase family)